jgi:hypothetical protein
MGIFLIRCHIKCDLLYYKVKGGQKSVFHRISIQICKTFCSMFIMTIGPSLNVPVAEVIISNRTFLYYSP